MFTLYTLFLLDLLIYTLFVSEHNYLKMVVRSFDEEKQYLEKISPNCWKIKKGFQPHMNVEGVFYVNSYLEKLMFDELRNACR